MRTYQDKLQELAIEALEENKDKVKKAMLDSTIEVIEKSPQLIDKLADAFLALLEEDSGGEEK